MNNKKAELQEKRIALIKRYLKEESSAVLYDKMSKEMIEQLAWDFAVDESQIVGFYEDVMKLGSALFASLASKYNTRGVLFLKDSFKYYRGVLTGVLEIPYDNIKFADCKMASTTIYYGDEENNGLKEDGTYLTLTLSGISFAEPSKIPELFVKLCDTNEDTFDITRADKIKNSAKKFSNFILEKSLNSVNKAESDLHMAEQKARHILNNPNQYSEEQIEKAKHILENREMNEQIIRSKQSEIISNFNENFKGNISDVEGTRKKVERYYND